LIRGECVRHYADSLNKETRSQEPSSVPPEIPKPTEIKETLDRYILGQDRAKKILSAAEYNHYKRIVNRGRLRHIDLQKGNILMIRSTGMGKTLLSQALARIFHVPSPSPRPQR